MRNLLAASLVLCSVSALAKEPKAPPQPEPRFTSRGVLVTGGITELEGVKASHVQQVLKDAKTIRGWAESYKASPRISTHAMQAIVSGRDDSKYSLTEADSKAARTVFASSLGEKDDAIRNKGLLGLERVGTEEESKPICNVMLNDPSKENRALAIKVAGKIKGKGFVPCLKSVVQSPKFPGEDRLAAINALAAIDSPLAKTALKTSLKSVKKIPPLESAINAALEKPGAFESK